MFDLDSWGKAESVFNQSNFVLDKSTVAAACDSRRKKGQHVAVANVVVDLPVGESPHEIIAIA